MHAGTSAGGGAAFAPLGPAGEVPHALPIFPTANFTYPDAAAAEAVAAGGGFLYSRHHNPTTEALESALAGLEGTEAGVAFASGMGATAAAVLACAGGGEVLASEGIYGGTTELLRDLGPRLGITTRAVAAWDTDTVRDALTPATRVLLVEAMTNPLLRIADLPALAALCRPRGIALVVDATFVTPYLCRPIEHGATLVVHSVSKYIGGHGDVIGGVVLGATRTIEHVARHRALLGATMDPFSAWLTARGLRTMPLRLDRQCKTALGLATMLAAHPAVKRVHHPGLPSHPDHARATRLLAKPGAMVSFELADGAAARRLYDRVRVVARAASLGEISSLLTHPATFSHRGLSPEDRARTGIPDGLLRLSVGLEDPEDLERDLMEALRA